MSNRSAGTVLTDQTYFKFDTHDLQTIHRAVICWCLSKGIEITHTTAIIAARNAFKIYSGYMEEEELASLLSDLMPFDH